MKQNPNSISFQKLFLNFESILFVGSQITVGLLNYFFQIFASRTLSTIEFGSWSLWLAQFSVACFVGVWFQSLTSIGKAEARLSFNKFRFLLLGLWLGFILSLILKNESLLFIFAWAGSLLNGFWFGVNLRTKKIKFLAVASLVGALSKFIWVLVDRSPVSFYYAQAAAPLLVCSCFLFFQRPKEVLQDDQSFKLSSQVALASVSLAFFTSWVPQVDLLVTPRIITPIELGIFAKVALLNKGFFFAFQTLAQLLLAYQVQPGSARLSGRHYIFFGFIGLLASAMGFAVALFLGWPTTWAILSLLHMTTLCLVFLGIQDLASRHRGYIAFFLCLLSLLLAFMGGVLKVSVENYWLFSIIIELVAVIGLVKMAIKNQDLTVNK